jgi:hypothetical protein
VTELRWLGFGDLDAGVWGLAWMPGEDGPGSVALGAGADVSVVRAELQAGGAADDWRLHGEGLELTISAVREDVSVGGSDSTLEGSDPTLEGIDQLARATGSFTLEGAEHQVDSLAWRAALRGLPELDKFTSQRLVAAWFEPADGLATLALRPRKARGQEGDLISAALYESGRPLPVSDPRLSTTYTGDGIPARAGVELWVSTPAAAEQEREREPAQEQEPEQERGPEQEEQEHPHRAAGEALGPRAGWTEGQLKLSAQPFRWHSHGQDGAGVYLLGETG